MLPAERQLDKALAVAHKLQTVIRKKTAHGINASWHNRLKNRIDSRGMKGYGVSHSGYEF